MSLTREDVRAAVDDALNGRDALDAKTHKSHHEFVQRLIEREKKKEELRQYARKQVVGWSVLGVIGAMAAGSYYWLVDLIKKSTGH